MPKMHQDTFDPGPLAAVGLLVRWMNGREGRREWTERDGKGTPSPKSSELELGIRV